MAAFSNVFGDVGLTDSEITGGCCAEGSLELMIPAEDVGFVTDRVVTAVRRVRHCFCFGHRFSVGVRPSESLVKSIGGVASAVARVARYAAGLVFAAAAASRRSCHVTRS
jgi:hypothetical protein